MQKAWLTLGRFSRLLSKLSIMLCLTRILQHYNLNKHSYCYKECRLFLNRLLCRRKFALMYTSLLTSVKSAGRSQKDKGCLEQHELTKALPVDHGSTPDFFWSQTDRKKTILLSYLHERSLWAGFKILNQNQRQFLPQRCYSALLWCRQTSSDEDIRARALAIPHINNV